MIKTQAVSALISDVSPELTPVLRRAQFQNIAHYERFVHH